MTTQVMLDLETMSTSRQASIASIGATKFDENFNIVDRFYRTVDLKDCKALGLHIDRDTVKWWSEQSKEAMQHLLIGNIPLKQALEEFAFWYGQDSMPIWSNGADFDIVVVLHAMNITNVQVPWKYWHTRCFRTIIALMDIDIKKARDEYQKENPNFVYHNALADAEFQTWLLGKALNV